MTPEAIAYLREKAAAAGYNPDDLLRAINYESSGDASRWGGKGGNYYGLIQFGPNERKTYGIDPAHTSETGQVDATLRFLHDRGFKPGMGMLDLYSTINAGSPGHYNASDGNGTVASHVAKMMGQPLPAGSAPPALASAAPATAAPTPQIPEPTGLLAPRRAAAAPTVAAPDDSFNQQLLAFHQANHANAMRGLL